MKRIVASITVCMIALLCAGQRTFTVMEYNCENAFDTIHDEGKDDYEYLSGGKKKWRRWKLAEKLRGIAKVIAAANEHRPVDLVGLCEVENDSVMENLTQKSILASLGYKYVMTHSQDRRGIDVALMYSPLTFHPFEWQTMTPPTERATRDILRVSGTLATGDTLDVYVVHLPSKLGGSAAKRSSMTVAEMLRENVDSVMTMRARPNVIVMGDFNAEPHSQQLRLLTEDGRLTDVTEKVKPGTYKYQGVWSTIDHVLWHGTTLRHIETKVLALPQLLEPDATNGGDKVKRTYIGPTYHGGISDHLPLVSRFSLSPSPSP